VTCYFFLGVYTEEVVNSPLFEEKLKQYLSFYKANGGYALNQLKRENAFEPSTFRRLYLEAVTNTSTLSYPKKFTILAIGNEVYQHTLSQLKWDLKKSQE
jgi:thiamine pyrophosphokinase